MTAAPILTWTPVGQPRQWSEPRPPAPNGATRGGTDHYTEVIEQATWPDDPAVSGIYAGRTYHQRWIWIGPEPGFRAVIIHHSTYPAPVTDERTPNAP